MIVVVELKQSKTRWPLRRPQRWYWVARSSVNGSTLAQSSEMYTNRDDAVTAIRTVFGAQSEVHLKYPDDSGVTLRHPIRRDGVRFDY